MSFIILIHVWILWACKSWVLLTGMGFARSKYAVNLTTTSYSWTFNIKGVIKFRVYKNFKDLIKCQIELLINIIIIGLHCICHLQDFMMWHLPEAKEEHWVDGGDSKCPLHLPIRLSDKVVPWLWYMWLETLIWISTKTEQIQSHLNKTYSYNAFLEEWHWIDGGGGAGWLRVPSMYMKYMYLPCWIRLEKKPLKMKFSFFLCTEWVKKAGEEDSPRHLYVNVTIIAPCHPARLLSVCGYSRYH